MSLSLSLGHMFPWAFKTKLVDSCQIGLYLFCAHGLRFHVLILKAQILFKKNKIYRYLLLKEQLWPLSCALSVWPLNAP